MDTAKRILYGIVAGLYLLSMLMTVAGLTFGMSIASSLDNTLHNEPPTFILPPIVFVWLFAGIVLLVTCIFRSRWLAKPKRALIPFTLGCVAVAVSLLPWFFGPPHRLGTYHVIGFICLAALAHDLVTCVRRARQLTELYGHTS